VSTPTKVLSPKIRLAAFLVQVYVVTHSLRDGGVDQYPFAVRTTTCGRRSRILAHEPGPVSSADLLTGEVDRAWRVDVEGND
jgi:hypothetical protein